MKLRNSIATVLCAGTVLLSGCSKIDNFLGEEPSKNSMKPIETVEQLDAILASYAVYGVNIFQEQPDMMLATDDFAFIPLIQDNKPYSAEILGYGLWVDQNVSERYSTWNAEYTKIYYANLVLHYLDKVSGSEEHKAILKADAHFLRAYSMYTIALAHTLYYDGTNGDELGICLKQTPSFEESAARANLADTWNFIEVDLQEALKITKPFIREDGMKVNWRGSKGSVLAFAARYYLYRADYEKAEYYALEALKQWGEFKDFNDPTEMYYKSSVSKYTLTDTGEEVEVRRSYLYNQLVTYWGMEPNMEVLLGWSELFYTRTTMYGSSWFAPTQELLDTFAEDVPEGKLENDLRYKFFMLPYYSISTFTDKVSTKIYPGYVQFMGEVLSGPTVAEMNLIVAECRARDNDATAAMQRVNALRKNRIEKSVYQDLTASSASVALKKVLQERRREMPFSIRWYDIKRLNANDPDNKVTVKRNFYKTNGTVVLPNDGIVEYVLEPNSRHYAIPIGKDEIAKSGNVIQQNTY